MEGWVDLGDWSQTKMALPANRRSPIQVLTWQCTTIEQELLVGSQIKLLHMHVHSADGSTFLCEMTSQSPFWKYDIISEIQLRQSMYIYLKNNPAKFHPDLIWNNEAFGFFEHHFPDNNHNNNNDNNNNKENKMSNNQFLIFNTAAGSKDV